MPIYAYRCSACGHAKDVLQKMSDPVLSICPACGAAAYTKQVTAAGFQLKGSGWYATDFKGGGAAPAAPAAGRCRCAGGHPCGRQQARRRQWWRVGFGIHLLRRLVRLPLTAPRKPIA